MKKFKKYIFILTFIIFCCFIAGCGFLLNGIIDGMGDDLIGDSANVQLKIEGKGSLVTIESKVIPKDREFQGTNLSYEKKICRELPFNQEYHLKAWDGLYLRITPKELKGKVKIEIWENDVLKKAYDLNNIIPLVIRWSLDKSKVNKIY